MTHEASSGLAYGTGKDGRLKEGDLVEQFQLLGLGVLLEDLIQNSRGVFKEAQDRHRFRVRINYDTTLLHTEEDIDFLYEFILDLKPAYLHFILSIFKYLVDIIEIKSSIRFNLRTRLFDDAYLLRGPADIYDDNTPGKQINMVPAYQVLSTWFPTDGVVTTQANGTLKLTSATGYFTQASISSGLLSRVINNVAHQYKHLYTTDPINPDGSNYTVTSWIRGVDEIANSNRTPGVTLPDYVVFRDAPSRGMYRIKSVQNVNTLILEPLSPNDEQLGRFEAEDRNFVIARLITDVVYDGVVHVDGQNAVHLVGEGIVHDGIAAFDELSFPESTNGRYVIRAVRREATDNLETSVFVNPFGNELLNSELQAPSHAIVRRPQLATQNRGTYSCTVMTAYGIRALKVSTPDVNNLHSVGVDIGDKAHIDMGTYTYPTYVVGIFGDLFWLSDIPSTAVNGSTFSIAFERERAFSDHTSYDQKEHLVQSNCSIILRSALANRNYNLGTHLTTGLKAYLEPPAYSGGGANTLRLVDTLPGGDQTIVNAIQPGDLLQVIKNPVHENVIQNIASHLFVDGYGILRVVEKLTANTFLISNPLPLTGAGFIGIGLDVKLIKQAHLTSVQWRFNNV